MSEPMLPQPSLDPDILRLVGYSSDGVIIISPNGRIIYANALAAQWHGYTPATLQGQSFYELLAVRTFPDQQEILHLVAEQDRWQGQLLMMHQQQFYFSVEATFFRLKGTTDEEQVVFLLRRSPPEQQAAQLRGEMAKVLSELILTTVDFWPKAARRTAQLIAPAGITVVGLRYESQSANFIWTDLLLSPIADVLLPSQALPSWQGKRIPASLFAGLLSPDVHFLSDLSTLLSKSPALKPFLSAKTSYCGHQTGALIPVYQNDTPQLLLLFIAGSFSEPERELFRWYNRQLNRLADTIAQQRAVNRAHALQTQLWQISTLLEKDEDEIAAKCALVLEHALPTINSAAAGWLFLPDSENAERTVSRRVDAAGQLSSLPGWTVELDQQLFSCLDLDRLATGGQYEDHLSETCPAELWAFFQQHAFSRLVAIAWPEEPGFLLLALPGVKPLATEFWSFWQEIARLLSQTWRKTANHRFLLSELKQTRAFTANALSLLAILKRLDASPDTSEAWIETLLEFSFSYFHPDGLSLQLIDEKVSRFDNRNLPEPLSTALQDENVWPGSSRSTTTPFLLRTIEPGSPWEPIAALMDTYDFADALVIPLGQGTIVYGHLILWLQQRGHLTPTQRAIAEHLGRCVALRWQATHRAQRWNQLQSAHAAFLSQAEEGLLLFDTEGNLLEANDAWYRLLGTTVQQEAGKTWPDSLAEHVRSCQSTSASFSLADVWTKREKCTLRCQLVTEKATHDVQINVLPVLNPAGQVTHVAVHLQSEDIWSQLQRRLLSISSLEKTLLASVNVDAMFSVLLAQLQKLFAQEKVCVGLVDKKSGMIRSIDSNNRHAIPVDEMRSLMAYVVRSGRMVNLPDVTTSAWYLPSEFSARSEICAPIRVDGEIIGAIDMESTKQNAFSIADETLLQVVAGHIADIVSLLKTFQTTSMQQALYRDALAFASSWVKPQKDDKRTTLLLRILQKAVPYNEALVAVLRKGYFEIVAEQGYLSSAAIIGRRLAATHLPFYEQLVTSSTPFLLKQASLPLLWDWEGTLQNQKVWCFPLCGEGEGNLAGFLLLTEPVGESIVTGDVLLLTFFVALLSLAIVNERIRSNWDRTLQQLNDLREMSLTLTSSEDPGQILRRLFTYSKTLVHWYTASIIFWRDETPEIILSDSYQHEEVVLPFASSLFEKSHLLAEIMQTRRPIIIADVREDERWITLPTLEYVRGWLGVPILAHDRVWGVLMMDSEYVDFFDQHDLEVTQILASYAAIVIEHERLLHLERDKMEQLEATRAEQTTALQISQELFEVVARNMESALVILDRQETIKYANASFIHLTGFSRTELLGKPYTMLCAAGDENEQRLLQAIRQQYQRGQSWHGRMQQRRKEGKPYLAEITLAPVLAATGEIDQFIVLQRDVTEMYRAMQSKDAFTSVVAHELRTPLASMKLHLDLLSRGQEKKRALYRAKLQQDINQLASLVTDLLEDSRLEMNKVTLELEPLSLQTIVEEVCERYRTEIEKQSLTLTTEFAEIPCLVSGDKEKLLLITSNLITNAWQHTPTGGMIRVQVMPCREEERAGCCLQLHNSGPGMPAEELSHLFNPFFKERTVQQSSVPGSGLGLSIVKSLVELHGGTIAAKSQPEHGVQFNVWLPVAKEGETDGSLPE